MDYLKRSVELSRQSFEAGEFPAGAVLVTKSGGVYESLPSVPHNHGETMVIDMAIKAEGAPLTDAKMYGSMQPCLMCSAKMYWAGIEAAEFVIPKNAIRANYAYENDEDTAVLASRFFKPIVFSENPEHREEALLVYAEWVKKIGG